MLDTDWMATASCHGGDTDWTPDAKPPPWLMAQLSAICDACPAREDCALWALAGNAATGVYAGVWIPDRDNGHGRHYSKRWIAARQQLADTLERISA